MTGRVLAGLLVCVLALAGCSSLAELGRLREDLRSAGYDANSIDSHTSNGVTELSIGVTVPDGVPTDEDAGKVAEVVWTKYPGDVDRLVVTMNGAVRLDASADELAGRFGERPGGLAESSGDGGGGALTVTLILVGAAVFAGLMVLLWHRGRRTPPPVAPPPGPYRYPPRPPRG